MNILIRIWEWYTKLGRPWKFICGLLAVCELVNVVSFASRRLYLFVNKRLESPITVVREIPNDTKNRTLVIEVGGSMGVKKCFDVFKPYCADYGIIFIDHSGMGYNIETQLRQIDEYIATSGATDIRVIGVSVGDYFARILEERYNAKTLPVNPEPTHKHLKLWAKVASLGGGVIAELVTVPAGWLSAIEWIPKTGEHFSIAYVADQFISLATVHDAPYIYENANGAIIAENKYDAFLNTEKSVTYYAGLKIIRVKSGHGDTVGNASVYKKALDEIFPSGTWE